MNGVSLVTRGLVNPTGGQGVWLVTRGLVGSTGISIIVTLNRLFLLLGVGR